MREQLQQLVTALREELQQYGELLALLDRQQEYVVKRAAADLLQSVSDINAQSAVIRVARDQRGTCQDAVARLVQMPEGAPLNDLIRLMPDDYAGLVKALLDENNKCLARVRRRAGQNHLLLSRSVELMQRLLGTLFSVAQTIVYNGNGAVVPAALSSGKVLCDAIG
jgi:flagellar biosynthesis/type III secretory pathway chaperone